MNNKIITVTVNQTRPTSLWFSELRLSVAIIYSLSLDVLNLKVNAIKHCYYCNFRKKHYKVIISISIHENSDLFVLICFWFDTWKLTSLQSPEFASQQEFCTQLHNNTILDSTRKSIKISSDVSVPLITPSFLFFTVAVSNHTAAVLHSAMPHLSFSEKSLQQTWTARGLHSAGDSDSSPWRCPSLSTYIFTQLIPLQPTNSLSESSLAASFFYLQVVTPCYLTSTVGNMETQTKVGFHASLTNMFELSTSSLITNIILIYLFFCNFHLLRPGKNRLFYAQNFKHQGTYCRNMMCVHPNLLFLPPYAGILPLTLLISSISMRTQPAQMVASILI